jgi:hypothetical protein
MTNAKHTPGPWSYRPQKYDDWGYVRGPKEADGFQPFICQAKDMRAMDEDVLNEHRRNGTDPWEANARLIAAAPDLLEALERIVFDWDGEPDDMSEAHAAIAKAKGRDA